MRAVVLATFGTVIVWLPSFGVLADRMMGNVLPPFVDSDILTFAHETGAEAVFATFHVTVCDVPPVQVVAEFGDVTEKGPAADVTLRSMSSEFTPPPAARLSRAVTLNFIVRVVVGSDSPIVEVLLRISESLGNVRVGLLVAVNERNNGRVPSSFNGGDADPVSISSQQ